MPAEATVRRPRWAGWSGRWERVPRESAAGNRDIGWGAGVSPGTGERSHGGRLVQGPGFAAIERGPTLAGSPHGFVSTESVSPQGTRYTARTCPPGIYTLRPGPRYMARTRRYAGSPPVPGTQGFRRVAETPFNIVYEARP